MIELLLAMFAGIVVGMFTGTLPGLGLTSTLFLLYVAINSLDPVLLLIFYGSLICSVQYFGSVVGIYLGIPGEVNSLIASKGGFKLMHKGQGGPALGATAIASFISASVGIGLFYILVYQSKMLLPLLSVKVIFTIFVLILTLLVAYKYNNILVNFLLVSAGLLLSMIGYNPAGISITFNLDALNAGLSTSIVMLMIYIIPNLFRYWNSSVNEINNVIPLDFRRSIGWVVKSWPALTRGTIIGCVSGLIPGVGPVVCSNIAGSLEQKINKTKVAKELVSAESANNAAILISLIPFFGLGLAILPHEAVVFEILVNKGITFNLNWLLEHNRLELITAFIALANLVAFLIAWPASKSLIALYKKINYKVLAVLLISFVLITTLYQSYDSLRIDTDILTLFLLAPITYFLTTRRIETLPLIFSYLIGDQVVKSAIFLYNIL